MTLLKSDHKHLRGQESSRPPADFGVKNIPMMYFCSKPRENVHKQPQEDWPGTQAASKNIKLTIIRNISDPVGILKGKIWRN